MSTTSAMAPNTLTAARYDGRTPIGEPVTLIWGGQTLKIIGTAIAQTYPCARVRVSPRIGRAARFLALPDGTQLLCADSALLDRLPQEGKTEGVVAWLEQRWQVAMGCLAVTVAAIAFGYFYGLPVVADRVASRVPIEYERRVGENALEFLDDRKFFLPSELKDAVIEDVSDRFARLAKDLPMETNLELEFRNAPNVGPNALAFPGGIIVITDQMIQLADSAEEVEAVLAHEIGHIEHRHALRHLVQDSATAAIAATFTSDVSSLTLAVSGIPVLLAQAKYSREFETQADDFAFELLKRRDISPEYFASLMERLQAKHSRKDDRAMSFLSSHPVTADRIARARAAAATFAKKPERKKEDVSQQEQEKEQAVQTEPERTGQ